MSFRALRRYWERRKLPNYTGDKQFHAALVELNENIVHKRHFAFARFGDGEMRVINGDAIDLLNKANGEHRYQPGDPVAESQRKRLAASLKYRHDRYFVGIACPCCVGLARFMALKAESAQPESQLTWANLFVNSNFDHFKQDTLAALATRPNSILVAHERAKVTGLPFPISLHIKTRENAWINDCDQTLDALKAEFKLRGERDRVVLFCAGVLSNIVIAEMHAAFPDNTYIDLGSVLDIELGLGETRKYLRHGKSRKKTCVWA